MFCCSKARYNDVAYKKMALRVVLVAMFACGSCMSVRFQVFNIVVDRDCHTEHQAAICYTQEPRWVPRSVMSSWGVKGRGNFISHWFWFSLSWCPWWVNKLVCDVRAPIRTCCLNVLPTVALHSYHRGNWLSRPMRIWILWLESNGWNSYGICIKPYRNSQKPTSRSRKKVLAKVICFTLGNSYFQHFYWDVFMQKCKFYMFRSTSSTYLLKQ